MPPIDIYTAPLCPFCAAAKRLLREKGATFTEIDVDDDDAQRNRMIERSSGRMTVPQIFIGATHVGGCDDLYELERAGGLDPLLNGQAAGDGGSAA